MQSAVRPDNRMQMFVEKIYRKYLPDAVSRGGMMVANCPFCKAKYGEEKGRIQIILNPKSYFNGFFRCQSTCQEYGFVSWFCALLGVEDNDDRETAAEAESYLELLDNLPGKTINGDVEDNVLKLQEESLAFFLDAKIHDETLRRLHVGYNGRYLVYPYQQWDNSFYSARCVHPDNPADFFWFGDAEFEGGKSGFFNLVDLKRCKKGTLFICEGEENLVVLNQLGFPGVGYSETSVLEQANPKWFSSFSTVFILPKKNENSYQAARYCATQIGFKVRIITWPAQMADGDSLYQLARTSEAGETGRIFGDILRKARPFSPFSTPDNEFNAFLQASELRQSDEYSNLKTGFQLFDERLSGVHGLNILGGAPKTGKSCFSLQIATTMAAGNVPVLYYDFENGRQRLYQRTVTRLNYEYTRLNGDSGALSQRDEEVNRQFRRLLNFFRVINDRKITPELMRRHIDFICHEMHTEMAVVIVDSLHKLPFKDLSAMRSGINSWLREFEAIRDEYATSFLVISELVRGEKGAYDDTPHMGLFKGSGDIEYSADNAMVLLPNWNHMQGMEERMNDLWLVASRESSPGLVARYKLEYPHWAFSERPADLD